MKKHQTIAAMILASGMSAFGQGTTPAPSLSKLEALAKHRPQFMMPRGFKPMAP